MTHPDHTTNPDTSVFENAEVVTIRFSRRPRLTKKRVAIILVGLYMNGLGIGMLIGQRQANKQQ